MTQFDDAIDASRDQFRKRFRKVRAECEQIAEKRRISGIRWDLGYWMRQAFREAGANATRDLLETLGRPSACIMSELHATLGEHLCVSDQDFDQAFDRSLSVLSEHCSRWQYSEPFTLMKGPLHLPEMTELEPVWEFRSASACGVLEICGYSRNNERLGFVDEHYFVEAPTADGLEDAGIVAVQSGRVEARVRAKCSAGSMTEIANAIRHIAPSLFKSACLVEQAQRDREYDNWWVEFDKWWSESEEEFFPGDHKDGPDPVVVYDNKGRLGLGLGWVRDVLDEYFRTGTHSKTDTFERRITNAVLLIAESDAQSNSAIGLALSITAVEAILGSRSEGIAQRLGEMVAVLLEPDPQQRPLAVKFIKRLYDDRSRVLHGESLNREQESVRKGRLVAAAVLMAFIQRLRFLRGMSDELKSPVHLLDELIESKEKRGQPIGVMESPVRFLWSTAHEE